MSDVVRDPETGLMWQDTEETNNFTWAEACDYCRKLRLGGYADWRLPHIDELKSLVDDTRSDPAIKPIFRHTRSGGYWSITEVAGDSSLAWFVLFFNGNDNCFGKSNEFYVRCVRE